MKIKFIGLLMLVALPLSTNAGIPSVYTNENFWTSEQDKPVQFFQSPSGNFFGFTTTGKYFTQTKVINEYQIPLHKFSIDRAYFYISDKGVITADSDLIALSIYLSKGIS